jgi:spore maturation protein CgeB
MSAGTRRAQRAFGPIKGNVKIVIIGLSATATWGNGQGEAYRNLVHELNARGHEVLFLDGGESSSLNGRGATRRKSFHAPRKNYRSLSDLKRRFGRQVRAAHVVIVGSKVPDAIEVGRWVTSVAKGVTVFYDVDTHCTLSKLEHGDADSVTRALLSKYSLYLSFSGGRELQDLERKFGSPMARTLRDRNPAQRAARLERYVVEAMTGRPMA